MKKALLFTALLFLVVVGCKKCPDCAESAGFRENNAQETEKTIEAQFMVVPPECTDLLPMDASRIPNYAEWIHENHIVRGRVSRDCPESGMIDVKPPVDRLKWLHDNEDYICYGREFNELIECRHALDYTQAGLVRLGQACCTRTWNELKNAIGAVPFRDEKFTNYLLLRDCHQDNISISVGPFNTTYTCYPIPLLRAIESNNQMNGSEEVKFFVKNNIIYFAVVFNPDPVTSRQAVKIYNFSQPLP